MLYAYNRLASGSYKALIHSLVLTLVLRCRAVSMMSSLREESFDSFQLDELLGAMQPRCFTGI